MRTEEELRAEIRRLEMTGHIARYHAAEYHKKATTIGMTDEQVDYLVQTRTWYMYQALRFALGYEYNSSNVTHELRENGE